ncbi:MAG: DUF5329 domain-containing protein, partial [Pseudomonadota bacterium]|nr:DUF5329 domain-containing protein [Pseudomonadota bacterium]
VETSGCEFYRNGTWYDSKRASAHLEKKYDYLVSRDQIKSAEEFIAKAATSSSMSGQVYQIRCAGSEPQASGRWFTDALAAYRLANKAGR